MYRRSMSSRRGSISWRTPTYSRKYCRCSEASWRKSSRLRGLVRSCPSLRNKLRFQQLFRGRLAIQDAVVQHDGLELDWHLRNRFGVAEEQVAARLQRVKKALHKFAFTLFRKIDEHVHAEDQVHLAHVHRIRKIHLDE